MDSKSDGRDTGIYILEGACGLWKDTFGETTIIGCIRALYIKS